MHTRPHVGHTLRGSSSSLRAKIAARSPIPGTMPAIRNQTTNELPLLRATTPAAEGEEEGDDQVGHESPGEDRPDDHHDPGDGGDHVDHDVQQDPGDDQQDDDGEGTSAP